MFGSGEGGRGGKRVIETAKATHRNRYNWLCFLTSALGADDIFGTLCGDYACGWLVHLSGYGCPFSVGQVSPCMSQKDDQSRNVAN